MRDLYTGFGVRLLSTGKFELLFFWVGGASIRLLSYLNFTRCIFDTVVLHVFLKYFLRFFLIFNINILKPQKTLKNI